jgi:hypothetical protein
MSHAINDRVDVVPFADLIATAMSDSLRQRISAADEYLRHRARVPMGRVSERTWLYLLRAEYRGRIKIGKSLVPSKRLAEVRQISPVEIELIASFPGTALHERALHHAFGAEWVRGEWYRACPDLGELATVWGNRVPHGLRHERSIA